MTGERIVIFSFTGQIIFTDEGQTVWRGITPLPLARVSAEDRNGDENEFFNRADTVEFLSFRICLNS